MKSCAGNFSRYTVLSVLLNRKQVNFSIIPVFHIDLLLFLLILSNFFFSFNIISLFLAGDIYRHLFSISLIFYVNITLNIYGIHNSRLCCQRQVDKRPKLLISNINHDEIVKVKKKERKKKKPCTQSMKIERAGRYLSVYKTTTICRILFLVCLHNSVHRAIFKFMSASFMDISLIKLGR